MLSPVSAAHGIFAETVSAAGFARRWFRGFGPGQERAGRVLHPSGQAAPVVLVHGLCANKSYWKPMEEHLLELGHPVLALNYSWSNATISSCGSHVADQVLDLVDRLDVDGVHLVGHSLGGVVIKWAIHHNPDLARVTDRVVSLGSPHQGSPWAGLPMVSGLPLLGSLIGELEGHHASLSEQALPLPAHIGWTTVGGGMDALVPADRAQLPSGSAGHHVFANLGHISMVSDPRVIRVVESALTHTPIARNCA